ncbi:MAG: hypothetical protein IRZ16_11825 [Myxococcaceae bacterium]|nr:hypothetical protein [Myxococcaceae bacterium]
MSLAAVALVATLAVASDASAGVPYTDAPYCSLPATCPNGIVEDFSSYSGFPISMGNYFVTPKGFVFMGEGLSLYNDSIIGPSLYFECGGGSPFTFQPGVIKLPVPSAWVTLTFRGMPATINFIAVNQSGEIIEAVTKTSLGTVEQIKLGPGDPGSGDSMIEYIFMWHVEDGTCSLDCGEPFITNITICDTCGV